MNNIAVLVSASLFGFLVGCSGAQVADESEQAPEVTPSVTNEVETTRARCAPGLGCAFGACYDSCATKSPANYCVEYCKCRVYDRKSDMQCQLTNPYIDL